MADALTAITCSSKAGRISIADIVDVLGPCDCDRCGHRDGNNAYRIHVVTCRRCDGKGKLPEFSHVDGGTCFRCNGSGVTRR